MCDELLKAHPEVTLLGEIVWEVTQDVYGLWDITSPGSSVLGL